MIISGEFAVEPELVEPHFERGVAAGDGRHGKVLQIVDHAIAGNQQQVERFCGGVPDHRHQGIAGFQPVRREHQLRIVLCPRLYLLEEVGGGTLPLVDQVAIQLRFDAVGLDEGVVEFLEPRGVASKALDVDRTVGDGRHRHEEAFAAVIAAQPRHTDIHHLGEPGRRDLRFLVGFDGLIGQRRRRRFGGRLVGRFRRRQVGRILGRRPSSQVRRARALRPWRAARRQAAVPAASLRIWPCPRAPDRSPHARGLLAVGLVGVGQRVRCGRLGLATGCVSAFAASSADVSTAGFGVLSFPGPISPLI